MRTGFCFVFPRLAEHDYGAEPQSQRPDLLHGQTRGGADLKKKPCYSPLCGHCRTAAFLSALLIFPKSIAKEQNVGESDGPYHCDSHSGWHSSYSHLCDSVFRMRKRTPL